MLCRTSALARAMICRWPTERFVPPPAIAVSRVIWPVVMSFCRENSPADRRASFSTASSYWWKGSKFWRRVPLKSSGYRRSEMSGTIDMRVKGTIWGMTVICDRRASRLILSVGNPSKYTFPSVRMHRKRARVRELFTPMSDLLCIDRTAHLAAACPSDCVLV